MSKRVIAVGTAKGKSPSGPVIRTGTWQDTFPRSVLDQYGPDGEPIFTPTDRRLLWHIENTLAIHAPLRNEGLQSLSRTLREYLNATCEHHWRDYEASESLHPDTGEVMDRIPAHRQCLWCNDVEWAGEQS